MDANPAPILDQEFETACRADTGDGGCPKHRHLTVVSSAFERPQLGPAPAQLLHDVDIAQARPLPLGEGLQNDKHGTEIGAVGLQQERKSAVGDDGVNAWSVDRDFHDLLHGFLAALQRSRIRKLDVDDSRP